MPWQATQAWRWVKNNHVAMISFILVIILCDPQVGPAKNPPCVGLCKAAKSTIPMPVRFLLLVTGSACLFPNMHAPVQTSVLVILYLKCSSLCFLFPILPRGRLPVVGECRNEAGAGRRRASGMSWTNTCPPRRQLPSPWLSIGRACSRGLREYCRPRFHVSTAVARL